MTQTVLTSVLDTYLAEASPTQKFGASTSLVGGNFRVGGIDKANRILIRANLKADIGDGQVITGVSLLLKDDTSGSGAVPSPLTYALRKVTKDADIANATWLNYDSTHTWTTAGGDTSVTGADSAILASLNGTLTFSNWVDQANDGYANRSGYWTGLIIGPEGVGQDQYSAWGSMNNATSSLHPVITITHSTSIHYQCALAVKAVIEALELEAAPEVKVRKFGDFRLESGDTPQQLIIVSTALATSHVPATNISDDITYPVTVTLFSQSDANLTQNHQRMLMWRERIRKAFHQNRLSGVSSVWMCNIPPSPPFSAAWFGKIGRASCRERVSSPV